MKVEMAPRMDVSQGMVRDVAGARVKTACATRTPSAAAMFGTRFVRPSAMRIATGAAWLPKVGDKPQEMAAFPPMIQGAADANVRIAYAPLIPTAAKPPGMKPVFKNAQMTAVDALETPEEEAGPLTVVRPWKVPDVPAVLASNASALLTPIAATMSGTNCAFRSVPMTAMDVVLLEGEVPRTDAHHLKNPDVSIAFVRPVYATRIPTAAVIPGTMSA